MSEEELKAVEVEEELEESLEEESAHFIKQRVLFPEDNRYFAFLKKVFRHQFRKSGFKRITVSSITKTSSLKKSGSNNIIEINPEYSIKTDSTLSILNSYINHEKSEELQPIYYYYVDNVLVQKKDYLKEHFII
jgi:histidyl-tRNA synthetase